MRYFFKEKTWHFDSNFTDCPNDFKVCIASGNDLLLIWYRAFVWVSDEWVQCVWKVIAIDVDKILYKTYNTNIYTDFSVCCHKIFFTTDNFIVT